MKLIRGIDLIFSLPYIYSHLNGFNHNFLFKSVITNEAKYNRKKNSPEWFAEFFIIFFGRSKDKVQSDIFHKIKCRIQLLKIEQKKYNKDVFLPYIILYDAEPEIRYARILIIKVYGFYRKLY